MEAITKLAVEAAGGPRKVADAIVTAGRKCTPQAVSQWRQVPDVHVRLVERLCAGRYTRYQLRPDIFGEAGSEVAPTAVAETPASA
jgi:DNA-binding transcriptional regulator YdaS (Cro superfamily)